ncbi:flagellar hook-basal body complex protein FliE [Aestuariivirga litoralis]|uniref:flagellar hook-basal body complex protein FliE n=1 Tax=Aestuariivirga litoralis TaxID=2650924 RepID=UPI0018C72153|nr:flagellar hook-basal body complex protein FliE [Aestuariivirga litoralis]MBG1233197.1 flagellar hook-basal body protein FliE [Aestuariivirga litoralis]
MINAIGAIGQMAGTMAAGGAAQSGAGMMKDVGDFAKHLAQTIQQGEAAGVAGVNGTMPVQQVVQQVLEAERAVTTLVSVRDKAVSGLLELTRMQV